MKILHKEKSLKAMLLSIEQLRKEHLFKIDFMKVKNYTQLKKEVAVKCKEINIRNPLIVVIYLRTTRPTPTSLKEIIKEITSAKDFNDSFVSGYKFEMYVLNRSNYVLYKEP